MKKTFLASLCLMTGMAIHAQQIDVQPVPQQFKEATETLTLTGTYQINGENEANPYAINGLKALLNSKQSTKEGMRIYIGERGDKSVRKYNKFIPKQDEGYFIRISPKAVSYTHLTLPTMAVV